MILTGSWETAALFRSWRPELPLLAETSGKNAMIVMPSADLDLAASDLIKSAFGHAGQKCSAASLAILVGPVGRSKRFARQLVDAATSLRVGPPSDPMAEVGPGDRAAAGQARVGAHDPRRGREVARRAGAARLRTGVRGAVLDVPASAPACSRARASTARSSSARCSASCTRTPSRTRSSCRTPSRTDSPPGSTRRTPTTSRCGSTGVEAGNLYVNRGITGAIVQRQPFGGWKRSSVGAGTKAGGPNYLIGLGLVAAVGRRGIVGDAAPARPRLAHQRRDRGGAAVAGLRRVRVAASRCALGRHRVGSRVRAGAGRLAPRGRAQPVPLPADAGRRGAGDGRCVVAVRAAGRGRRHPRGCAVRRVSAPVGLPAGRAARRSPTQGVAVFVETDEQEWIERGSSRSRAPTTRLDRACVWSVRPSRSAPLHRALVGGCRRRPRPRGLRERGHDRRAASSCCRSCTSSRSRSPRTASATPTPGASRSSDPCVANCGERLLPAAS